MIDFIFGAAFLWFAYSRYKHYKRPAEVSRSDIRTNALVIMAYSGIYGGYQIWQVFGGAPFGGF